MDSRCCLTVQMAATDNATSTCPFPFDEVCPATIYGCTDPLAYGYNPEADVDDGSCYYDGDQCDVAHTAVLGENQADGETEWFQVYNYNQLYVNRDFSKRYRRCGT